MPGSNAVGHGRKDGTAGNVTAALWTSSTAEKRLRCIRTDCYSGRRGRLEFWLRVSDDLHLDGPDLGDGRFRAGLSGGLGGLAFFVGAVVSSASSSSSGDELVWAPPVLTTTPGGACDVVDPGEPRAEAGSRADFSAGSAAPDSGVADVDASVDVDSVVDDSVEGVSAHAAGNPYPVTTAAPTPRATAKPPLTDVGSSLHALAIREVPHHWCGFQESAMTSRPPNGCCSCTSREPKTAIMMHARPTASGSVPPSSSTVTSSESRARSRVRQSIPGCQW